MLFKDEMRISLMQAHHSIFLLLPFKNLIVLLIMLGIIFYEMGRGKEIRLVSKLTKWKTERRILYIEHCRHRILLTHLNSIFAS